MSVTYFTTGDIGREVVCDDLTVRRYLEIRDIKRQDGAQFRFDQDEFEAIVSHLRVLKAESAQPLRRLRLEIKARA